MLSLRITVVERKGKICVCAENPDTSKKLVKSKFGNIMHSRINGAEEGV